MKSKSFFAVAVSAFIAVSASAAVAQPGGWAVVDPETGDVKNVIVCTEDVCGKDGAWGGVLPDDTDCPGCLLVEQTEASEDGNVSGHRSSEDTSVTYREDSGDFSIVSETVDSDGNTVVTEDVLVPPSDDPEVVPGMSRESTVITTPEENEQSAEATVDNSGSVTIDYPFWENARSFSYANVEEAIQNHQQEIEVAISEIPEPEPDASVEPEASPSVVDTIRSLASRIVSALSSWFNR
jgi:hypothetical protein